MADCNCERFNDISVHSSKFFDHTYFPPDYWNICYPLCYYFVGAYIREYRPAPTRFLCVGLLAISILIPVGLQYLLAPDSNYAWWIMNGFNSFSAMGISVLVFLLCYQVSLRLRLSKFVLKTIASASFGIYLISYYIEPLVYGRFSHVPGNLCIIAKESVLIFLLTAIPAVLLDSVIKAMTAIFFRKK